MRIHIVEDIFKMIDISYWDRMGIKKYLGDRLRWNDTFMDISWNEYLKGQHYGS